MLLVISVPYVAGISCHLAMIRLHLHLVDLTDACMIHSFSE